MKKTTSKKKIDSENSLFLTALDLSKRWNGAISINTLSMWRSGRKGPKYIKIGGKVLYPLKSVKDWEQTRLSA